jgi:hypothetical protein
MSFITKKKSNSFFMMFLSIRLHLLMSACLYNQIKTRINFDMTITLDSSPLP